MKRYTTNYVLKKEGKEMLPKQGDILDLPLYMTMFLWVGRVLGNFV